MNRSSPVPLYFQVAEQIEQAIHDGQLAPGDRIANEVALADQLGLSRPRCARRSRPWSTRGMLVRKRGVGTQVVNAPIRRTVELTSLYDDLTRSGLRPTTTVLGLELVPVDEPARREAQPAGGQQVWRLRPAPRGQGRAAGADVQPRARGASPTSRGSTWTHTGLYEHFRAQAINLRVAHQVIGARTIDAAEARLLGGRKGDPVLTMERTSYDDKGRAVEHGQHLYRPDRYAYETTLVDR